MGLLEELDQLGDHLSLGLGPELDVDGFRIEELRKMHASPRLQHEIGAGNRPPESFCKLAHGSGVSRRRGAL